MTTTQFDNRRASDEANGALKRLSAPYSFNGYGTLHALGGFEPVDLKKAIIDIDQCARARLAEKCPRLVSGKQLSESDPESAESQRVASDITFVMKRLTSIGGKAEHLDAEQQWRELSVLRIRVENHIRTLDESHAREHRVPVHKTLRAGFLACFEYLKQTHVIIPTTLLFSPFVGAVITHMPGKTMLLLAALWVSLAARAGNNESTKTYKDKKHGIDAASRASIALAVGAGIGAYGRLYFDALVAFGDRRAVQLWSLADRHWNALGFWDVTVGVGVATMTYLLARTLKFMVRSYRASSQKE